jgi:hypothetical protein
MSTCFCVHHGYLKAIMFRKILLYKIFLAMLLTSVAILCKADCTSYGVRIFPKAGAIATNSIFIVQGYAKSQKLIENLNVKNAICVCTEKDTVPLIVQKIITSPYALTQAICKPARKLQAKRLYQLIVDNLTDREFELLQENKTFWTVSDWSDTTKPQWLMAPSVKSKEAFMYGCGPAEYVNFCTSFSDSLPIVVHTKVKNLLNKDVSEFYLFPDSNRIRVGHGMCSGAFDFGGSDKFEAIFTLMDASGNLSEPTAPIEFVSPSFITDQQHPETLPTCYCSQQQKAARQRPYWILIGLSAAALGIFALQRKSKK